MKDIEAWWIDFMEGEMDPKIKKDLQTLLKNSRADQHLLKEYLWLREWVKASEPRTEWSESRQTKLHDRIMTTISDENVEKVHGCFSGLHRVKPATI